jgi:ferric-chelate reductase
MDSLGVSTSRAGQHVKLRVFFTPSVKQGGSSRLRHFNLFSSFRCLESHPFTIAVAPSADSVSGSAMGPAGFSLYASALKEGTWTSDLYEFSKVDGYDDNDDAKVKVNGAGVGSGEGEGTKKVVEGKNLNLNLKRVRVLVDGPYGGLGLEQPCASETVVLFAAGSGISYVLGVADEVVGRAVRGKRGARTESLEIVWVVRRRG